jgi:hypothetical protein
MLLPVPVAAQTLDQLMTVDDPQHLIDAFKAICVDPGADAKAQGAAATSVPWKLKFEGKDRKLGAVYSAFPLQVTINGKDGVSTCDVTSMLPETLQLAEFETLAEAKLGVASPKIDETKQTIHWDTLSADGRSGMFGLRKGGMGKIGVIVAFTPAKEK